MLEIHRVLHASDFSPTSQRALEYSMLLGQLLGAPVDVIHVVPGVGPHRVEDLSEAETEHDPAIVEQFRSILDAVDTSSTQVRPLIGYGPLPGPVVLEEAHRSGTNFIVLGAHGGGSAQEDKLGSVSTDIVRRSTCPVLIIPPHVTAESVDREMERVVTFVSYAHLIEPVVVAAVHLAELFGARLDVLAHVPGPESSQPAPIWEDVEKNLMEIMQRQRERTNISLSPEKIQLHALRGDPIEEILAFTKSQAADMLIVEAPGLASMDSPSEQAVEELVGRAPCPVILINTCGRPLTKSTNRSRGNRPKVPVT